MNKKLGAIALLLSFSVAQVMASPVLAQTISATEAAAVPNYVYTKPLLDPEILDLTNTYRSQLEQYRNSENRYQVAKVQFQQLNTLQSLEAAVKATNEAMAARDAVLITYLRLLRLLLIQTNGINLDQKNPTVATLEQHIQTVQDHAVLVAAADDRYELATVADSFDVFSVQLQQTSYRTLSLLAVGKLQTVYDQALSLSQEIGQVIATAEADIKQGERQRAYTEVQNQLSTVQQSFSIVNAVLSNSEGQITQFAYSNTLDSLQTIYGSLWQGLSFMAEILNL